MAKDAAAQERKRDQERKSDQEKMPGKHQEKLSDRLLAMKFMNKSGTAAAAAAPMAVVASMDTWTTAAAARAGKGRVRMVSSYLAFDASLTKDSVCVAPRSFNKKDTPTPSIPDEAGMIPDAKHRGVQKGGGISGSGPKRKRQRVE